MTVDTVETDMIVLRADTSLRVVTAVAAEIGLTILTTVTVERV